MEQTRARGGSASVVGELYEIHARRLQRIVGSAVRAPDELIEDACQIAWSRLLAQAGAVPREAALPWLVTTASREAIKLARRVDRDVSLEALLEDDVEPAQSGGVDELIDLRDRLGSVGALPPRQQQLVWLAGLGFSYREMADQTRSSRRTVERQLLRAKHTLRAAA